MTAHKLKCFNIFKKKKKILPGIVIAYILNKNVFMEDNVHLETSSTI